MAEHHGLTSQFVSLFQVPVDPERGKFLSRVFGIFSEEIVRLWSAAAAAPYEDLGRPTIRFNDAPAYSTLDFTLRHRVSRKVYVAELKCEIEYQGFRYFVLKSADQLAHHNKRAFQTLLRAAHTPSEARTIVRGRPVPIDGAILIWGSSTESGAAAVKEQHKFADVLTIESMIGELIESNNEGYHTMLRARRKWLDEMFIGLAECKNANTG